MFKNAGQYPWRILWLQCVRTLDSTTGDKAKTYSPNGALWGNLVLDDANEQKELGAERSTIQGKIFLRGKPTISALDRVYVYQFLQTYIVDGVRQDFAKNEIILDVHLLIDGATY